jgi:hypothetical protein
MRNMKNLKSFYKKQQQLNEFILFPLKIQFTFKISFNDFSAEFSMIIKKYTQTTIERENVFWSNHWFDCTHFRDFWWNSKFVVDFCWYTKKTWASAAADACLPLYSTFEYFFFLVQQHRRWLRFPVRVRIELKNFISLSIVKIKSNPTSSHLSSRSFTLPYYILYWAVDYEKYVARCHPHSAQPSLLYCTLFI